MAWTLAHVIVHLTASAEEKAFLAAEMARGVRLHGRSRYEVPWQTVMTIAQCRQRLAECRRMCLASLDMWPDDPCLLNKKMPWPGYPRVDARGYFILGLSHAAGPFGTGQGYRTTGEGRAWRMRGGEILVEIW